MGEIGGAHLPDRHIELADRPSDQDREQDRQRERDRAGGEREVGPRLPPLGRHLLQPFDLALGQTVAGGEHRLRTLGELRVALSQRRARRRRALRRLEQQVKPTLGVGQLFELCKLRPVERELLQLLRGLSEIPAQTRVVFDELRIVENQVLANDALERGGLLVELPARAAGLRGLQYRLLTLRSKPVEAHDQLDQRVEQRQADKKKPEQDELEKGARIVHGGLSGRPL